MHQIQYWYLEMVKRSFTATRFVSILFCCSLFLSSLTWLEISAKFLLEFSSLTWTLLVNNGSQPIWHSLRISAFKKPLKVTITFPMLLQSVKYLIRSFSQIYKWYSLQRFLQTYYMTSTIYFQVRCNASFPHWKFVPLCSVHLFKRYFTDWLLLFIPSFLHCLKL